MKYLFVTVAIFLAACAPGNFATPIHFLANDLPTENEGPPALQTTCSFSFHEPGDPNGGVAIANGYSVGNMGNGNGNCGTASANSGSAENQDQDEDEDEDEDEDKDKDKDK